MDKRQNLYNACSLFTLRLAHNRGSLTGPKKNDRCSRPILWTAVMSLFFVLKCGNSSRMALSQVAVRPGRPSPLCYMKEEDPRPN